VLDSESAARLAADSASLVGAILGKDFDLYADAMKAKGETLSRSAGAIAKDEFASSRYEDLPVKTLAAQPVEQQIRFLWEHPERRNFEWASLNVDRVRCGTGWMMSGDWTGPDLPGPATEGVRGLLSIFEPPVGKHHLVSLAEAGTAESAWVQFPVQLRNGVLTVVRITFVNDAARGEWYPLRMDLPHVTGPVPVPLI